MGRLRDFSAKCWTLPALNFCNCSQRLKQTKLCINEDAQKGCFESETNPWSRDAISIVRQENPVEGGVRLPEPGVRIKLNCKGFMCAGAIADPGWIQSGSRPWKYNLRWHFESEKKAIQIPNSKWQLTRYSQPLFATNMFIMNLNFWVPECRFLALETVLLVKYIISLCLGQLLLGQPPSYKINQLSTDECSTVVDASGVR